MSFSQTLVQIPGACGSLLRRLQGRAARHMAVDTLENKGIGQSCIGQGITWIDVNGLIVVTDGLLKTFFRSLVPVIASS